jgi:probable rRNA maturation factor
VTLTIEVVTESPSWAQLPAAEAKTRHAVEAALRSEGVRWAEIGIALADDARIRGLNRDHRGVDKATNVLAFPSVQADRDGTSGDIVIAYETLAREAGAEGKPIENHLMHLAVHGTLHLLGFDHMSDQDAERMEARERAILSDLGVPDPYAEPEIAGTTT